MNGCRHLMGLTRGLVEVRPGLLHFWHVPGCCWYCWSVDGSGGKASCWMAGDRGPFSMTVFQLSGDSGNIIARVVNILPWWKWNTSFVSQKKTQPGSELHNQKHSPWILVCLYFLLESPPSYCLRHVCPPRKVTAVLWHCQRGRHQDLSTHKDSV